MPSLIFSMKNVNKKNMKWIVAGGVVLVAAIVVYQFIINSQNLVSNNQGCVNSGGTVGTSQCCKAVNDFPNTCLIGACGCSPAGSHEVKVCECPQGKCFDGNECV